MLVDFAAAMFVAQIINGKSQQKNQNMKNNR